MLHRRSMPSVPPRNRRLEGQGRIGRIAGADWVVWHSGHAGVDCELSADGVAHRVDVERAVSTQRR
eukprot:scaffold487868_cov38-Prasinocladus_malaysianus.AAC.1